VAVMSGYEGFDNWLLELGRDLHGDNYMYVECKDDKMDRRGNHMIWRS
jgi:hypothetical protein